MSDAESAVLDWQGPIRPTAFVATDDPDIMQEPAVYLCAMTYDAVVTIYVGMTKNFLHRLRDHLAATLGLTYWLRDDAGRHCHDPSGVAEYLMSLNDAQALQDLARAEIERMTWFFAPAEPQALPFLEGLLIRRVRVLEGAGAMDGFRRIISENGQAGRAPSGPLVVENRGADWPLGILGASVEWPMADAA
ncbi:MAG: GIY-YIG nuclease family protein [Proteobacteria bacterium]|nr:GIY-YIG nuclease family protein [Pseudomonadota bacterium]